MALKRTIGPVARGKDCFFERSAVINGIWKKISGKSNVLIAAPRRVGKTSLMNIISDCGEIESAKMTELAQTAGVADGYKDIVNSLVYDGYINNDGDARKYKFNSPILKDWWYKNVAN